MRRYFVLPACVLSLWLASLPVLPATPDRNAGVTVRNQRLHALKSAFFVNPPPRLPPLRHVVQAQAQTGGAASGPVPADAAKAENEKRWGEAERGYREAIAKEPNRVDLLLRLVDVLAVQGKKLEAAQTLGRAAD